MILLRNLYKNSKTAENDFFVLLRAGMWQRPCGTLSPVPDWPEIYRIAADQTVQGILIDGISIMGAETLLTEEQSAFLFDVVSKLYTAYDTSSALQKQICAVLDDNHIKYRVVKGLDAATYYPKPYMRIYGDVDVLLPYEDYIKAREVVAPLAKGEDGNYEYAAHKGYFFEDGEVELHGTFHPNLGERIDRAIDRAQAEMFDGTVNPDTFNAFCYFLHCVQHIFFEGLGLRQVMDFTLLLGGKMNDIDKGSLDSWLDEADLKYEWDVFLSFAHKYLVLPKECLSMGYGTDERTAAKAADALWKVCRRRGNMGKISPDKVTTEHFWLRKLQKLRITHTDWRCHRLISPQLSKMRLTSDLKKYFHINK